MPEEKKKNTGRETKAGMMEENSGPASKKEDQGGAAKKPEDTPKISKNEAADHNDDRPLH